MGTAGQRGAGTGKNQVTGITGPTHKPITPKTHKPAAQPHPAVVLGTWMRAMAVSHMFSTSPIETRPVVVFCTVSSTTKNPATCERNATGEYHHFNQRTTNLKPYLV